MKELESGELPEWVSELREDADRARFMNKPHRQFLDASPENILKLTELLSSSLQSNRELREQLATVLAREAATTKRYDDKLNSEKGGEK